MRGHGESDGGDGGDGAQRRELERIAYGAGSDGPERERALAELRRLDAPEAVGEGAGPSPEPSGVADDDASEPVAPPPSPARGTRRPPLLLGVLAVGLVLGAGGAVAATGLAGGGAPGGADASVSASATTSASPSASPWAEGFPDSTGTLDLPAELQRAQAPDDLPAIPMPEELVPSSFRLLPGALGDYSLFSPFVEREAYLAQNTSTEVCLVVVGSDRTVLATCDRRRAVAIDGLELRFTETAPVSRPTSPGYSFWDVTLSWQPDGTSGLGFTERPPEDELTEP